MMLNSVKIVPPINSEAEVMVAPRGSWTGSCLPPYGMMLVVNTPAICAFDVLGSNHSRSPTP